MVSNKTTTFIENKKFNNILKVIFLLIVLFIIYKYFTSNINHKKNDSYEHFTSAMPYTYYGNVITLKNQLNKPEYIGNQCIFELDDIYRIDTLIFYFNYNTHNNTKYTPDQSIYIQYLDGNGKLRYIKSGNNRLDSPPSIHTDSNPGVLGSGMNDRPYYLSLTNITDEQNLPVYTSKIIILIGTLNKSNSSNNISISEYNDPTGYGYVYSYGIFGGSRKLLNKTSYDSIAKSLSKAMSSSVTTVVDAKHQISTLTFANVNTNTNSDMQIYSIKLMLAQTPAPILAKRPSGPFNINIQYNNSIYLSNNFNITNTYKIRSDLNQLSDNNSIFIFLDEPIIANTLIFKINNISNYTLTIESITINGSLPTADDIIDFKRNVNTMLSSNGETTDVCPNINDLLEKQSKTQSICDNLEFQDKVKSEKVRLERNKQYLLKLKDQQDKIDELNNVIQDLETKRSARAVTADQARLLQYQNQKGNVSTVIDLANQRLASQDKNKLYMDLKLNYK